MKPKNCILWPNVLLVKLGYVILINGRTWLTLREMEESGPMGQKEEAD